MQKTDRFLLGFVLGALLVVVMVLVLAVRRPPPEYQPEDKPENIALNYLLALQRADYARAYATLSPALRRYPASAAEFAHLITINRWMLPGGAGGTSMLRVTDTRRVDASAFVTVRETLLVSQGLFGSQQQTNDFQMELRLAEGKWKLIHADSHWLFCLEDPAGCESTVGSDYSD